MALGFEMILRATSHCLVTHLALMIPSIGALAQLLFQQLCRFVLTGNTHMGKYFGEGDMRSLSAAAYRCMT